MPTPEEIARVLNKLNFVQKLWIYDDTHSLIFFLRHILAMLSWSKLCPWIVDMCVCAHPHTYNHTHMLYVWKCMCIHVYVYTLYALCTIYTNLWKSKLKNPNPSTVWEKNKKAILSVVGNGMKIRWDDISTAYSM